MSPLACVCLWHWWAPNCHLHKGMTSSDVLDTALKDVSAAQGEARAMAHNFSAGDPNVNLQDVMVNLQKASMSFQQMVQVRNRLVTAYQDIMNMPV